MFLKHADSDIFPQVNPSMLPPTPAVNAGHVAAFSDISGQFVEFAQNRQKENRHKFMVVP